MTSPEPEYQSMKPFENTSSSAEKVALDERIAKSLFDTLRQSGFDGVGITRSSYAKSETAALDIIEEQANALGLPTERDAGANLVVTLQGSDPELPFLACGSHVDSVPQGGNYDGAAGVIAGLLVLARLKREGIVPRRTIRLFGLRGEESARFGKAYIGSSALLGKLGADDLALTAADDGRTLANCMRDVDVAVDRVARGEPLLDASQMAAWIELHIEQGPVLVARDLPVGIVTGIRGAIRHRSIGCIGEAGHSGAVPRGLRRDSIFALAELITTLDRHWLATMEAGEDLAVTSGIFGTDPSEHAISRIPGRARFSLDIRSQNTESLARFYGVFKAECARIEKSRGVVFSFDPRLDVRPAKMDPDWVERLKASARALGVRYEEMQSGAGHDAALFANAGIPAAMIFVRNRNGSHNPNEAMDMDDFIVGVSVMATAIEREVS